MTLPLIFVHWSSLKIIQEDKSFCGIAHLGVCWTDIQILNAAVEPQFGPSLAAQFHMSQFLFIYFIFPLQGANVSSSKKQHSPAPTPTLSPLLCRHRPTYLGLSHITHCLQLTCFKDKVNSQSHLKITTCNCDVTDLYSKVCRVPLFALLNSEKSVVSYLMMSLKTDGHIYYTYTILGLQKT